MAGFIIHRESDPADRLGAKLGASQTFDPGDPVQYTDEQLIASPADATPVLDSEFVGFAGSGSNFHSSTRTGAANGFGGNTNDDVSYIPGNAHGFLLRTKNYWTTPGTQIAKTGALIGTLHQISAVNATDEWGVESTAGVVGTDAVAQIIEVLNENMQPINPADSLTAGDGWLVFRMIANPTLQAPAGDAAPTT